MDSIETEGPSVDDAIALALARLGVARDRIEVQVLADASRGLFGFGSKPARVRATLRSAGEGGPSDIGPVTPVAPIVGTPDPAPDKARVLLSEIIRLVGVEAHVVVANDAETTRLDIVGDPSGLLIGRRGQTLDALEYLVNRIAGPEESGGTRWSVDANGYRARRRQTLETQARRLAEQARASGRPVGFNPLPPRERRIVHLVLQDDPTVTTRSDGDGYHRRVMVIPAARRRQRG